MKRYLLISFVIWVVSLATVYIHTREKWFDLGQNSGAVAARANLVSEICMFATIHEPTNRPDLRLDVKASRLEIRRKNNLVEIHCKK